MTSSARVHENLVIGGGLAGAMAALRLRAAGREVLLLEKEQGPHHKVCGEFLSPEALKYLHTAGIDPLGMGASPVESLRVSAKRSFVHTLLPFRGLSLSRRVLDEALLERAEDTGCEVCRGTGVQRLSHDGDRWIAHLANGQTASARSLFLANGKHDLSGWSRPPGSQNDLVGFKMHWHLRPEQTAALRGCLDLFLFERGYGGLALIEGDVANLCLVIRRSRLRRLGDWHSILAALYDENVLISERLSGAEPLWGRPLAISSIPYGHLPQGQSGLWRLGDQAAVIPSFTGDGMAIALHSGAFAAGMYLAGKTPNQYHRALRRQLQTGMSIATLLSRAMVSQPGLVLAPFLVPLLPRPIGWIARFTRIPPSAIRPVWASNTYH